MTLKVHPPGHEIFASESFERLMGCSHERFIKDGAYESFCDAQSLPRLLKAFDSMQAGLNVDVQIHGHNYRGQELWLRVQSRPV